MAKKINFGSELAKLRWKRIPKKERAKHVPTTGGPKRKFPPCERYGNHRFSPTTGRCPCGYIRKEKNSK